MPKFMFILTQEICVTHQICLTIMAIRVVIFALLCEHDLPSKPHRLCFRVRLIDTTLKKLESFWFVSGSL